MNKPSQFMKIDPQSTQVNVRAGAPTDVVFTVQNISNRPIRIEALIEPLAEAENKDGEPLPPAAWSDWLTVDGPSEVNGGQGGVIVDRYTVHVSKQLRPGTYQFRLLIVGIDDPDRDVVRSKPVTLTVTGSEIDMWPFVYGALAFVALILVVIGIVVWMILKNGTSSDDTTKEEASKIEVRMEAASAADTVVAGQWVNYRITIGKTNTVTSSEMLADPTLSYTLPKGAVAAELYPPKQFCKDVNVARRCWKLGDLALSAQEPITNVTLSVLAGTDASVIDNSESVTLIFTTDQVTHTVPAQVYANAKVTQILPADAIYVPPELPAAQKALSDAWQARNALGIDSTAARNKAVAARQTLSTTLWSLSGLADNRFLKIMTVSEDALKKLGGDLEKLTNPAIKSSVEGAKGKKQAIDDDIKQGSTSLEKIIEEYQLKYEYAQSLVEILRVVAQKNITVSHDITVTFTETDAKAAANELNAFATPLSEWPPLQTLIALADLDLVQGVQEIRVVQDGLVKTLPALESWLQVQLLDEREVVTLTAKIHQLKNENDPLLLTIEQRKTVNLLLALQAVHDLQQGMEVLVAEDRVDAAQKRLDEINDAMTEDSKAAAAAEQAAHARQQRMAEATQQSVSDRPPLEMGGWQDLYASVGALQDHEAALQWLATSRLTTAVDDATGAALTAAKKYAVERWIGPYLDAILRTKTPVKSLQEIARTEALLAAQVALKDSKAAAVDQARKNLQDALEEQNRLTSASGNTALRQEVIDSINAYRASLDEAVNAAKVALDKALAAQQAESEPSAAAAAIPPALVEALAQQIAEEIAQAVVTKSNQVDFLRASAQQMLAVEQAIQLDVKSQLSRALVAVQRPTRVRLFYDAEYAIQQLDQELASGRYSYTERTRKTLLRTALADLQLALRHLLAVPATQQQPGADFQTVIRQIADESSQGATMTTLLQELQDALGQTKLALRAQGDAANTSL